MFGYFNRWSSFPKPEVWVPATPPSWSNVASPKQPMSWRKLRRWCWSWPSTWTEPWFPWRQRQRTRISGLNWCQSLGGLVDSGAGWNLGDPWSMEKTRENVKGNQSQPLCVLHLDLWERKRLDTCSAAKGTGYIVLMCMGRQMPNWTSQCHMNGQNLPEKHPHLDSHTIESEDVNACLWLRFNDWWHPPRLLFIESSRVTEDSCSAKNYLCCRDTFCLRSHVAQHTQAKNRNGDI